MQKITLYIIASLLIAITACEPYVEDKIDIGLPPNADFSFEFDDPNNITFTNTTTDNNFIASWDFGNLGVLEGNVVEMNFLNAGDYEVTLNVFGKGGSGSVTKTVTITQDDPGSCSGPLEFITGCGTKTWKLNPDEGALWVGPNDGSGSTWWQNSASDVTSRPCDWNDEYVFSVTGTYDYISNGDFWGEPYSGFNPEGCQPITALSADRATWADGTHNFSIIPGATPKIRVSGDGAFLGLRKAANGMEVTHPISEVTYDIIRMETVGNKDILELEIDYAVGIWRITFASE